MKYRPGPDWTETNETMIRTETDLSVFQSIKKTVSDWIRLGIRTVSNVKHKHFYTL